MLKTLTAAALLTLTPLTATADVPDPACGYDVHGTHLYVKSLTAAGKVQVYLKDPQPWAGLTRVREPRAILPTEIEVYSLHHRHTNNDFVIMTSGHGRKVEDGGRAEECEQA